MKIAFLVPWPDCQECQSIECPHLHWLNAVMDKGESGLQGATYICASDSICPLNNCPRIKEELIITKAV